MSFLQQKDVTSMTHDAETTHTQLVARMIEMGAHLVQLVPGMKKPMHRKWPLAIPMTLDAAMGHLNIAGNLGVSLAPSRWICIDAENAAATQAVLEAGFTPTVIPAKAQAGASLADGSPNSKAGGSHTWLRLPDDVDIATLPSNSMKIQLPNGGVLDVLAGTRFAVSPPSRLAESGPTICYAPAAGGPLDPAVYSADPTVHLDVAPRWLFDASWTAVAG